EDFPNPSGTKLGGRNGAGHFCSTTACAWLSAYLGPDVPAVKQPCEDFYAYVCAQHPHSVYVDGRARLMVAMKEALLGEAQQSAAAVAGGRHSRQSRKDHAVVLQRCLAGGEPVLSKIDVESACEAPSTQVCPSKMPEGPNVISDEFFRRNHNATVDEFVAFVNRRKLDDSEGSGTLLHPSYTNGQLFFVLWALGHCGELKGATLVNTVARNSGHFAEAFQCTTKTTMSAVEKCSPNAQV
ncbi:hypothetical protein V5799_004686, partial [Amblyomma americanum]